MAGRKKIKMAALPSLVQEAGLQERWKRGELMVEEGADPNYPNRKTTRLRRKCVYDEMLNRGMITIEQRNYAENYAILCEKALGATQDLYAKVSLMSVSRSQWEPSQTQHEAYGKLFILWYEIGKYHTNILNKVVLGNMNATQLEEFTKSNRHINIGQIMSAFILLEQAFEKII